MVFLVSFFRRVFVSALGVVLLSSVGWASIVETRILSDFSQVQPGGQFRVGVSFVMPEGWHIYGQDAGDVGQPTALQFRLPEGWEIGEIEWPTVTEFELAGFKSLGYADTVVLSALVSVPVDVAVGEYQIGAEASWVACEVQCVPESATLSLKMSVSDGAPIASDALSPPTRLGYVRILGLLGFAFLGGIILNLMPCVFPVLSLKILGFVHQAAQSRWVVFKHGLVFSAGVLATFLVLAGVLIGLRSAGQELGWGFHLQSPIVVSVLALVFLVLGIWLLGLIEWGESLGRLGQWTVGKSGMASSFWNGVLAVIVATPCTAPFMGSAVGVAVAQPGGISILIFASLGLGMSMPYLILSAFPAWIKYLPRPGIWMVRVKQVLAVPLFATVVWLLWVLSVQRGWSAISLWVSVVAMGACVMVLYRVMSRRGICNPYLRAISGIVIVGVALIQTVLVIDRLPVPASQLHPYLVATEAFSISKLDELRASNTPVFVDVTASWCLTCQVNEKLVLRRQEVQRVFRDKGVTILVADWTDRDEEITRYLASFGRSGVPLYVGYFPGKPPVVLSEILTQEEVLGWF